MEDAGRGGGDSEQQPLARRAVHTDVDAGADHLRRRAVLDILGGLTGQRRPVLLWAVAPRHRQLIRRVLGSRSVKITCDHIIK